MKPGDKGLIRPPVSVRVSTHKNEVRSIPRGYFQNQFRVPVYKQVGRPTHDSQKREEDVEKVTNVFSHSTHSPRTQTNYPTYPLGTMWKLGGGLIPRSGASSN